MWWKITSVVLILYVVSAGLRVPLKPGITYVSPETAKTGQTVTLQLHGYNSFYTRSDASGIRVWLEYDSLNAIMGQNLRVLSDTTLEAVFTFPGDLPRPSPSVMLNAIIDHPHDGVSLLPGAVEVTLSAEALAKADTATTSAEALAKADTATTTVEALAKTDASPASAEATDASPASAEATDASPASAKATAGKSATWAQNPVGELHIKKDFTFPYRNVIYESIRNTYFHVPMWFALMFMFIASVVFSVRFLMNPRPDFDRKAAAYAETGLLFGGLGLVTGMLWAHYAWGAAWSNDIKQLMTAVALLIYLAYFILRASFDEPEKGARLAAVYNIFAFSSLIPLLYIVPRMFASLHPGATGNPAFGSEDLDNTMRLVFYPSILGFTGLGFWIAELRIRYQRLTDKASGLD